MQKVYFRVETDNISYTLRMPPSSICPSLDYPEDWSLLDKIIPADCSLKMNPVHPKLPLCQNSQV